MRHVRPLVIALGLALAGLAAPTPTASAAATPVLSAAAVDVSEGASTGRAKIVLRLDREPKRPTTVAWRTVDGTAKAGEDYRKQTKEVRFDVGQRKRTISVPLIDDDVVEDAERFLVRLRSTRARAPKNDVKVVIRDDDGYAVQLASALATSHDFDDQVGDHDPTLRGKTLSATGPDGTVYTLDVPDGALAEETTVTMTPWKSATGTGVEGGRLVGVRLAPSGTQFLLPVTLRIDPPGPDNLPAVTLTREGDTSYGYPAALDTDRLVMHLTHFSEFYGGVGEGTSIKIVDPGALDPHQALAAEMQRLLGEERTRQLLGQQGDPQLWQKIEQLMTSFYENVVKPKLSGIRVSCDLARADTGFAVGFARQAALLGILESQQQTILDAAVAGAENCLQEALEPCVDPEDIEQISEIVGSWRQVVLLGGTVPDPDPLDPVRHCQDLVAGELTITFDKLFEANGFRTEEHWTLIYQPRLVRTQGG